MILPPGCKETGKEACNPATGEVDVSALAATPILLDCSLFIELRCDNLSNPVKGFQRLVEETEAQSVVRVGTALAIPC